MYIDCYSSRSPEDTLTDATVVAAVYHCVLDHHDFTCHPNRRPLMCISKCASPAQNKFANKDKPANMDKPAEIKRNMERLV
jgi:hypothetical protein